LVSHESSEATSPAEGVYRIVVAPTIPTSRGRWVKFRETLEAFFFRDDVRARRDRIVRAAADGGEAKLREPAIKNAQFEAETMKLYAEARRAQAEAALAEAQAAKMLAEVDQVKEDTQKARSERIRAEFEFLESHGILVAPVHESGSLMGVYFEAPGQSRRVLVAPELEDTPTNLDEGPPDTRREGSRDRHRPPTP
jgi:hypothetical protein